MLAADSATRYADDIIFRAAAIMLLPLFTDTFSCDAAMMPRFVMIIERHASSPLPLRCCLCRR